MNRLKFLREKKGMKQTELGRLLNVKDSAISKYESGKIPLTSDTLLRLSQIFDVSIDYLLCNDGSLQEFQNCPQKETTLPFSSLTDREEDLISAFRQLSHDNQDIIIGDVKKYLKEQHYEELRIEEKEAIL